VGEESALENPLIRKRRGSHHPKAVAMVGCQEGALSVMQTALYFTDSMALGSQAWMEEVFERNRVRRARELKTPVFQRDRQKILILPLKSGLGILSNVPAVMAR
jgi:hypothetical protein